MPKKVDHEERKELIFMTALEVFAKTGYHNTSLSLIAQECKLSRTTVYEYFKDKADVFQYGIKKVTDLMLSEYTSPQWIQDNKLAMLCNICNSVIEVINKYRDEIYNFVSVLSELDIDVYTVVRRRSAKLKLELCRIIRNGIESGQIKKTNAEETVENIFILIESYCFQMCFLGKKNAARTKELLDDYLNHLQS